MSILPSSISGGHLAFSCKIGYTDFTAYVGSVEGITKQVGFDATPHSCTAKVVIAGCTPTLTIGSQVLIGLTSTDSFDANHIIWCGQLTEVATLAVSYELTVTGALAKANEASTLYRVRAITPADTYSTVLGAVYGLSGDTPIPSGVESDGGVLLSASTSTLGNLQGTAEVASLSVTTEDSSGATIGSATVLATDPLVDLPSWNTFAGTPTDGLSTSQEPMAFHYCPTTTANAVKFVWTADMRADSGRSYPCWWPAGYDQYYSIDLTVKRGTTTVATMASSILDTTSDTGPTSFAGWVQADGVTKLRKVVTQETTKAGWTAAAVISGLFGNLPGLIVSAIKAAKNENKSHLTTRTVEVLVGTLTKTNWWKTAATTLGWDTTYWPESYQGVDATRAESLTGEIDLINDQSFILNDDNEWALTPGIKKVSRYNRTAFATNYVYNELTKYQYHGNLQLNHPNIASSIVSICPETTTRGVVITQTTWPCTVNAEPMTETTLLAELGLLGSCCAYESGRLEDVTLQTTQGVDVAVTAPTSGTLYEVPICTATCSSMTYQTDNPLPSSYQLSFTDAYGIAYTYTYTTSFTGSQLSLNYVQGNMWLNSTADGQPQRYPMGCNDWSQSPGTVYQHLSYCADLTSDSSKTITLLDNTGATAYGVYGNLASSGTHALRDKYNNIWRYLCTGAGYFWRSSASPTPATTDGPVLDITPVVLYEQRQAAVFAGNLTRKTYTVVASMAFAEAQPGDVVLVAMPEFNAGAHWVAVVMGVAINQGDTTLTICPMYPTASATSSAWTNWDLVNNLLLSMD